MVVYILFTRTPKQCLKMALSWSSNVINLLTTKLSYCRGRSKTVTARNVVRQYNTTKVSPDSTLKSCTSQEELYTLVQCISPSHLFFSNSSQLIPDWNSHYKWFVYFPVLFFLICKPKHPISSPPYFYKIIWLECSLTWLLESFHL